MSFHRIVAALDDSELGKAVFAQAVALAQKTPAQASQAQASPSQASPAQKTQTSLLFFSAIDDGVLMQPTSLPSEVGLFSPDLMSSTYQAQQVSQDYHVDAIKVSLQRYHDTAQHMGVQADTLFKLGDIGSLLCAIAQDWEADLIIVGRRGRKGLSEALLGSVSNYVVHHAHCSVLVVQGEPDQKPNTAVEAEL